MLVYLLHTPWKFEMSVGSKTDGSVNWAWGVQQRVREFAAVFSDTKTKRIRFALDPSMSAAKQRAPRRWRKRRKPLGATGYDNARPLA